jgi:hypothetical protein
MSGPLQIHAESFRSVLVEMLYCPVGPAAGGTVGHDWRTMAHGSAFIYRLDGEDCLGRVSQLIGRDAGVDDGAAQ